MADIQLVLVRGCFTATATYGMLSVSGGGPLCVTVERDRDNNRKSTPERGGACIPAGTYALKRVDSPSQGNVFQVMDVPGRDHILIHPANWSKQLRGCIAPGDAFEMLDGEDGVAASKRAMAEVMKVLADVNAASLVIIDAV